MKRLLFTVALIVGFSAISCDASEDTRVKIRVENSTAETVLNFSWMDGEEVRRETLTLVDGRGEWNPGLPDGTTVNLINMGSNIVFEGGGIMPAPALTFFIEKGDIEIAFDANRWPEATIKGGDMSREVNEYWLALNPLERESFDLIRRLVAGGDGDQQQIMAFREQLTALRGQITQAKIDFMRANPDSPMAIYVYNELIRSEFWPLDVAENYFKGLSPRMRGSEGGQRIAEMFDRMRMLAPGAPAPLFSKTDKDGRKVSLADYRGKYVLIDFWGTWCGPCRASHPHLVEQYERYSPLGLIFINIAEERGRNWRDNWLAVIKEDGLVWTNIADNEFPEEGRLVDMFQITAFPTKYLIDPEGRIVGNSFHIDIDAKLAEIFGK